MSRRVGFIVEDQSDLDILHALATRIATRKFSVSHFIGRGCGAVRRKARPWCENLAAKGCAYIAIVHDRDRNDVTELRSALTTIVPQSLSAKTSIIIPIEEIEAWLLSDAAAIGRALKLQKAPQSVNHPEKIVSPKEYLVRSVRKCSLKTKTYIPTVHNRLVARELSIEVVREKCPSFCEFHRFVIAATS